MDLTVHIEKNKKLLNCRVAALIVRDGKILLEDHGKGNGGDGFLFLIGGRISYNTSTKESLRRELQEEVNVTDYKANLAICYETFFTNAKNMTVHEFGYIYKVETDQPIPESIVENGRTIHFKWVDVNDLKNKDVRPFFIKDIEQYLDGQIHHLIVNEADLTAE